MTYDKFTEQSGFTPAIITLTASVSGTNGTLTLPNGSVLASTPDQYANVIWNSAVTGNVGNSMYANGNLLIVCGGSAGGGAGTNQGASYVSTNMAVVTNLNEIAGKTFTLRDCDGSIDASDSLVFNANGSGSFNGEALTAADLSAYFSAAGITDGADNLKGRIYKFTSQSATKYYMLEASIRNGIKEQLLYTAQTDN